ncbi:hypothetical protein G9A89_003121 [Geosiphon pyriformis]|nr:hypothetical protein G9A89_003121 [Geosiphon pyriformis]
MGKPKKRCDFLPHEMQIDEKKKQPLLSRRMEIDAWSLPTKQNITIPQPPKLNPPVQTQLRTKQGAQSILHKTIKKKPGKKVKTKEKKRQNVLLQKALARMDKEETKLDIKMEKVVKQKQRKLLWE